MVSVVTLKNECPKIITSSVYVQPQNQNAFWVYSMQQNVSHVEVKINVTLYIYFSCQFFSYVAVRGKKMNFPNWIQLSFSFTFKFIKYLTNLTFHSILFLHMSFNLFTSIIGMLCILLSLSPSLTLLHFAYLPYILFSPCI